MLNPRPISLASIHQLRERYQSIKRLDLKTADIDFIKRKIGLFLKGSERVSPCLRIGYDLYRARAFNEGHRPKSLSEISYPDPKYVTQLGRANRPGCVLFYGSTGYGATVFEIKPSVGQLVSIGKWTTKEEMRFNHVGHSDKVFRRLKSNRNVGTSAFAHLIPNASTPSQRYVHEKLADEFAREVASGEEHQYKISVAIAELLLTDFLTPTGDQIALRNAAIMYPSIGSYGNSENVAIKPWFVDQSLRFREVHLVRIEGLLNGEDFSTSVVDFANSIGEAGTIEWKGRGQQWSVPPEGRVTFKAESGQWVARDHLGNVVEAH